MGEEGHNPRWVRPRPFRAPEIWTGIGSFGFIFTQTPFLVQLYYAKQLLILIRNMNHSSVSGSNAPYSVEGWGDTSKVKDVYITKAYITEVYIIEGSSKRRVCSIHYLSRA